MSWDEKLLQRHLTTRRFGREAVWFDEVDSTNRWLAEHMADFAMTGGIVIADHQTAGRGRYDRTWNDVPGACLLFSVLIHLDAMHEHMQLLNLLPGIATAETLANRWGHICRVSLKWPNDVLMNERKICGVLGQSVCAGGRRSVIVGVGINVNCGRDQLPTAVQKSASSILSETTEQIQREILLAEILNVWESLLDDYFEGKFQDLRERWEALGPTRGALLQRKEADRVLEGTFEGLGERGELLLRDHTGALHTLLSGDVNA